MVKPEPASSEWPWPDALDAMVAAKDYHTLLMENDRVRVLEVRISPGAVAPLHTHRWPGVQYILGGHEFIRRDGEGKVLLDTREGPPLPKIPIAVWSGPIPPHSVENVGTTEIHVVSIELKN